MSYNGDGEIYSAGENFTLPLAVTAGTNITSEKALFKVPKICNVFFGLKMNSPPPLSNFSENLSVLGA